MAQPCKPRSVPQLASSDSAALGELLPGTLMLGVALDSTPRNSQQRRKVRKANKTNKTTRMRGCGSSSSKALKISDQIEPKSQEPTIQCLDIVNLITEVKHLELEFLSCQESEEVDYD
jgi:hypothetical protein